MKGLFGTGAGLIAGILVSSAVNAASVSYIIDDSNVNYFDGGLADGGHYLTVSIDDEGAAGLINFSVDIVDGALSPTNNFGIQSFAFNITDDLFNVHTNDLTLPTNWVLNDYNGGQNAGYAQPSNADGYGKFDVVIGDGGQYRQPGSLSFSIAADGDDIYSYFGLSAPTVPDPLDPDPQQPTMFFAAHVTGINTGAYTIGGTSALGDQCLPGTDGCVELSSAWFGSTGNVAVVPVPAAAWLFMSGLIGLIGVSRRKQQNK
ncbi:MAG: hypothetical protein OEZ38_01505 [Gammaproteobacteria bacterium]|nr:hypothetical protein [Gammaproteobacteria bacterium]